MQVKTFDHEDGSSSTPLVKDDGSVQIVTVIGSVRAPASYRYELGLPEGARAEVQDDGSVMLLSVGDKFLGGVAVPWAKDARGVVVPTRFRVEGSSLIQEVVHSSGAFTYPIIADPWLGGDLYLMPWINQGDRRGHIVSVMPITKVMWWAHRDEVKTKLGRNAWLWNNSVQEQFYCHIATNPASLGGNGSYDMESWRPLLSWFPSLIEHGCNH